VLAALKAGTAAAKTIAAQKSLRGSSALQLLSFEDRLALPTIWSEFHGQTGFVAFESRVSARRAIAAADQRLPETRTRRSAGIQGGKSW
jgi:hypothetical protein